MNATRSSARWKKGSVGAAKPLRLTTPNPRAHKPAPKRSKPPLRLQPGSAAAEQSARGRLVNRHGLLVSINSNQRQGERGSAAAAAAGAVGDWRVHVAAAGARVRAVLAPSLFHTWPTSVDHVTTRIRFPLPYMVLTGEKMEESRSPRTELPTRRADRQPSKIRLTAAHSNNRSAAF